MEPINMIIIYYSDKKLPKTLYSEDLRSLAQKLKIWGQLKGYTYLSTCSKWLPLCLRHTWNRRSWRTTCMRIVLNPLLNWKWPSPRRFVPSGRKSVSGWVTASLVGFKCVWGAKAVIWNMCSNKCILSADLKSSVFELETSNLQFFNCYHISFQEM